ncbi:HAD family hydrolase [Nocardia sp. alder85J]|uniref:HAD family hydrolase n=1 Tax=Nocardia sp. alder85J TaxID=2862949 RepID=UPI001CD2D856|nr:HAD family phosphatase [Nocardia sp. alder85J]MCX4098236.1 HAD family phosphatase [Nocardia sp. alder85J]
MGFSHLPTYREQADSMIPGRPDAIVFDCDGTLMDTHACVRHALDEVFQRRGRLCSAEIHEGVVGLSIPAMAVLLTSVLCADADRLAGELLTAMIDHVPVAAVPLPGAVEIVTLAASDLPVAIASNSPRPLLNASLTQGGLLELVHVTVAADEVRAPKPAPDLYLAACRYLDVAPHRALAIEDSPIGVTAARAAGLTVLTVGPRTRGSQAHVDHLDNPILLRRICEISTPEPDLVS